MPRPSSHVTLRSAATKDLGAVVSAHRSGGDDRAVGVETLHVAQDAPWGGGRAGQGRAVGGAVIWATLKDLGQVLGRLLRGLLGKAEPQPAPVRVRIGTGGVGAVPRPVALRLRDVDIAAALSSPVTLTWTDS